MLFSPRKIVADRLSDPPSSKVDACVHIRLSRVQHECNIAGAETLAKAQQRDLALPIGQSVNCRANRFAKLTG